MIFSFNFEKKSSFKLIKRPVLVCQFYRVGEKQNYTKRLSNIPYNDSVNLKTFHIKYRLMTDFPWWNLSHWWLVHQNVEKLRPRIGDWLFGFSSPFSITVTQIWHTWLFRQVIYSGVHLIQWLNVHISLVSTIAHWKKCGSVAISISKPHMD